MSKLEVKNVGATIVYWHFVPKLDEQRVCKPWISLSADSGLLLPGEVCPGSIFQLYRSMYV